MSGGSGDPAAAFPERLRRDRADVAAALTEEAIARNPDLLVRFPETGRVRTEEDYGYVLEYLAVALELDDPRPFLDFARWTARILDARKIPPAAFAGALDHVREHLGHRYGEEAVPAADAALAAAAAEVRSAAPGVANARRKPGARHRESRAAFLLAILDGDRKAALTVAREALASGVPLRDVYLEVVQGALYEIGERWAANQITVADEHLATAVAQSVLAHLYPELPAVAKTRGRIVIAGVEGELHQIGANVVADLLEADGFEVRFLGTNVPPDAVARTVEEWKADALGVSMTMLHHLPRLRTLLDRLRRHAGPPRPVVLGGAAVAAAPALAGKVEADAAVTDLADLYPVFRRLAAGPVKSGE